jgi:hypothetical protein
MDVTIETLAAAVTTAVALIAAGYSLRRPVGRRRAGR